MIDTFQHVWIIEFPGTVLFINLTFLHFSTSSIKISCLYFLKHFVQYFSSKSYVATLFKHINLLIEPLFTSLIEVLSIILVEHFRTFIFLQKPSHFYQNMPMVLIYIDRAMIMKFSTNT